MTSSSDIDECLTWRGEGKGKVSSDQTRQEEAERTNLQFGELNLDQIQLLDGFIESLTKSDDSFGSGDEAGDSLECRDVG